jgi:lipopolysaccharide export LptBFGC system permease protein LptF
MRILERYVTAEILKTFLFALLVFTAIFFVGSLYTFFREDLSLRQIAKALPYALPYSLPFLVPIALLVGCALGYGRLAADNEIVPISTSGVHLAAVVAPAALLGIVLSALIFGLEATLIPYWNFQQKSLVRQFIEALLTKGEGHDKRVHGPGFDLFARRYRGLELEGVEIVFAGGGDALVAIPGAPAGADRPIEIVAERARVEPDDVRDAIVLTIDNAEVTSFEPPPGTPPPAPPKRGVVPELGPRGTPRRMEIGEARLLYPYKYRGNRLSLDFQSSKALVAMRERLAQWRAAAQSGRGEAEAPLAAAAAAGLFAAPGGGPGAEGLALARTAASAPGAEQIGAAEKQIQRIDQSLSERTALALAPVAFSLIAAAVPLLLRHNNRLVPFFVAFAIVSVTWFTPFIAAQSIVEHGDVSATIGYGAPVAATLAAGALLLWKLFRK